MRWRLFAIFMTITGVFCFVLLTSATDYGSGAGHRHPLAAASAGVAGGAGVVGGAGGARLNSQLLSTSIPVSAVGSAARDVPAARQSVDRFDPLLRPASARLFVARDADLVWERHELEKRVARARSLPKRQSKLRYDADSGWYREESALVTAYCPCAVCCGTQSPGITSIGKNAWTPGLAADPLKLEYGTKVFVDGYGMSVVDDTGGAMRRHWRRDGIMHIDVRMTYHYEARQWGKRYMRVRVYEND